MKEHIPSCFRGRAAAAPPPSPVTVAPALSISTYATALGPAVLSWSRTTLGLSLLIDLASPPEAEAAEEPLRFRVRPWILWKRRGSKRFDLHHPRRRSVEVIWDLTRARFPDAGGPEPCAGFHVTVLSDGELVLAAGDAAAVVVSRREHAVIGGGKGYRTAAVVGGREREIRIEIEREKGMNVAVDGRAVLQVRRIRWKFRGSERIEAAEGGGGGGIQISWDLHRWIFDPPPGAAASPAAVIVFRFDNEEGHSGKQAVFSRRQLYPGGEGYFGKSWNLSEGESSPLSSGSSASRTSSVMEWESAEEAEMRGGGGFSLMVYGWKR